MKQKETDAALEFWLTSFGTFRQSKFLFVTHKVQQKLGDSEKQNATEIG